MACTRRAPDGSVMVERMALGSQKRHTVLSHADPGTANDQGAYGVHRDAVRLAELSVAHRTGGVDGADLAHLFDGQDLVQAADISPTLRHHVVGVVFLSAEKQVRWIDARPVIAPVQDAQAVGDVSVDNQPRSAVGLEDPSLVIGSSADLSVSGCSKGSGPRPARIRTTGSVDLGPEEFNALWCKLGVHCQALSDDAAPPAVPTSAGDSISPNYTS
jgi:hypothetical protein